MNGTSRLQGIFTPNMIPLDAQGRIHEPEYRRYIDWLVDHGVDGLYPNGSTSEFTRFTAEERRRNIEIVVDQVAGRVPVLAGAAEANVRETLAACEYYAGLGVRAVAIVSPFYYRLSPDNVYAYFREIGRNTPVDVTLYNIPMFASPIDVPTIQRLSEECPRIVAIKDSSGDIGAMMRMIDAVRPNRPDFSFLTGWDCVLLPMLLVGCDGATLATSGIVPEITRKIYDLARAGRIAEARAIQTQLTEVFDAVLYSADFPEGVRTAIELRGFCLGVGRQPLSEQHKTKLRELQKRLRTTFGRLGLGDNETFAGSAAGAPQVQRIVESVLAALSRQGVAVG